MAKDEQLSGAQIVLWTGFGVGTGLLAGLVRCAAGPAPRPGRGSVRPERLTARAHPVRPASRPPPPGPLHLGGRPTPPLAPVRRPLPMLPGGRGADAPDHRDRRTRRAAGPLAQGVSRALGRSCRD